MNGKGKLQVSQQRKEIIVYPVRQLQSKMPPVQGGIYVYFQSTISDDDGVIFL